jgi:hypothetical protein
VWALTRDSARRFADEALWVVEVGDILRQRQVLRHGYIRLLAPWSLDVYGGVKRHHSSLSCVLLRGP